MKNGFVCFLNEKSFFFVKYFVSRKVKNRFVPTKLRFQAGFFENVEELLTLFLLQIPAKSLAKSWGKKD